MENCRMRAPWYQTGTRLLFRHHLPFLATVVGAAAAITHIIRIPPTSKPDIYWESTAAKQIFKPNAKETNALEAITISWIYCRVHLKIPKVRR